MSEQERGPYTPPRDEPLAFDARGARDARPMPMTLIASGVVLVVLIGGVVMAYVGGGHRKDESTRAVGDKVVSMKTLPAPGQVGPADPAGKLEVFANRTTASGPPAFTPAPEQPAERPQPQAPKPQLQVQASKLPPVRIATGDEAPAVPAPTVHPVAAAPIKPAATLATAAVAKPPAAVKPGLTAKTATGTVAPAVSGGVGAQIGAFSSKELADQGFAEVGTFAPIAGHGKRIEPVAHGASTLYRTTVTGFADRDAAKAFCATLAAKGHACIVKG